MTAVVLLGGARSGKSALAVELARGWEGAVTFVATGEGRDEEMRARIAQHQRERPPHWQLVEEPTDLATLPALARAEGLVVIDCVSLWVSNLLERGDDDTLTLSQAEQLASLAARRPDPVIVVTNEVGLGVVPQTPLGRRYRDLLGTVNSIFVAHAESAQLLIAGRALPLQPIDPTQLLRQ